MSPVHLQKGRIMDPQILSESRKNLPIQQSLIPRFPKKALCTRNPGPDAGRIIGVVQGNATAPAEAADYFFRQAQNAVSARGRFNAALCGGGTAERTYDLLSRPPLRDQIDWEKTHIYLVNELCARTDEHQGRFRMLNQVLLAHVPVPLAHIHPIPCNFSCSSAALYYNDVMQHLLDSSGLDLIFLQWGEYGHNCFFPNQVPIVRKTHAWTAELHYPESDLYAVTLTMRAVYRSRKAVFLIRRDMQETD